MLHKVPVQERREKHIKFLLGNVKGKRPLGRHRRRWKGNIGMDLREIG
jgi:hypothetical protein